MATYEGGGLQVVNWDRAICDNCEITERPKKCHGQKNSLQTSFLCMKLYLLKTSESNSMPKQIIIDQKIDHTFQNIPF